MVFKTIMIFKDFIKYLIVENSREFGVNAKIYKKSAHLTRDFDILSL